MSREVKRVPLDFDWPLNRPWDGYVQPRLPECQLCRGSGYTPARAWLERLVTLILIAGEHGARGGELHPYLSNLLNRPDARPPSRDMADLTRGLAGRMDEVLGHDALDRWNATAKIVSAAGLDPLTWGICPACGGEGYEATPEQRAQLDAWQRTDPPSGEGWQLWETVSEGSPITPVFATADELIEHLVAADGYRHAAAETLVRQGASLGSFVALDGVLYDSARDADLIEEHRP